MAYGLCSYPEKIDSFQYMCEEIDPIFKGWIIKAKLRSTPPRSPHEYHELIAERGLDYYVRCFYIPTDAIDLVRAEIIKKNIQLLAQDIKLNTGVPDALSNFLNSLI